MEIAESAPERFRKLKDIVSDTLYVPENAYRWFRLKISYGKMRLSWENQDWSDDIVAADLSEDGFKKLEAGINDIVKPSDELKKKLSAQLDKGEVPKESSERGYGGRYFSKYKLGDCELDRFQYQWVVEERERRQLQQEYTNGVRIEITTGHSGTKRWSPFFNDSGNPDELIEKIGRVPAKPESKLFYSLKVFVVGQDKPVWSEGRPDLPYIVDKLRKRYASVDRQTVAEKPVEKELPISAVASIPSEEDMKKIDAEFGKAMQQSQTPAASGKPQGVGNESVKDMSNTKRSLPRNSGPMRKL